MERKPENKNKNNKQMLQRKNNKDELKSNKKANHIKAIQSTKN